MEYYLDPVTGDDVSGDGSQTNPFQSFPRLYEELKTLDPENDVYIYPAKGAYTSFDERFFLARSKGRFIFDGSPEGVEHVAGPFVLSGVTAEGPVEPQNNQSLATNFTVTGAGWTDEQYSKKFIQFTDGAAAGYCLPIQSNTQDTLRSSANWNAVQAGDSFNIVECPIVIDVPHPIYLESDTVFDHESSEPCHMLFCGFEFRTDVRDGSSSFYVFNERVTFSMCSFVTDGFSGPYFKNSFANNRDIGLTTFNSSALSDFYSFANTITLNDGVPFTPGGGPYEGPYGRGLKLENSHVVSFCCSGSVCLEFSTNFFGYSMCEYIFAVNGGSHALDFVYCDKANWAIDCHKSALYVHSIYASNCARLVHARGNGYVNLIWARFGTATDPYSYLLSRGATVCIWDSGATGSVELAIPTVKINSLPAKGNQVTNLNSSLIVP